MTEDKQDNEIKTGTDLELEQLKARLDAMEASHQAEVDELKKANRDLWAAAHPAANVTETREAEPAAPVWDDEKVLRSFNSALGIKEDE